MMKDKELWKAAGKRLAAARLHAGYLSQKLLASAVDLAEPTIAKYEQGVREIPLSLLFWLSERHGMNANWIITGQGEMLDDPSKAPAPTVTVDPELMEKLYIAVATAYRDMGQKPPQHRVAREATDLFNALVSRVADVRDTVIVDAVIPALVKELMERLSKAAEEPGTGKRSAS